MSGGRPPATEAAFFDLSAEHFPIQIWALDAETYELRWHVCIPGPGAVFVPSKHEVNEGRLLEVVVRGATGVMSINGAIVNTQHTHKFQGQTLRHSHPDGDQPHEYFGHPEDVECACYDPLVFGHQSKWCPGSMMFGLDDEDTYLRAERDEMDRTRWYAEAYDEMAAAERRRTPLLRRVMFWLLGVRRKAL